MTGFTKIVYRPVVAQGEKPQEYPQTADQACQAIGANLVTGYRVERREIRTHGSEMVTLVSVYGSTDETSAVLFGVYEFHGRM